MLPHVSEARVDPKKVEQYLLSETHPVGRMKAAFFRSLGFRASEPEAFIAKLKELASTGQVVDQQQSKFGTKWVVDGILDGERKAALVRTIWLTSPLDRAPRLITAYPAPIKDEKNDR